jgi:hypothetical protein
MEHAFVLCCWQVIDEALRQLLTVQAQQHASLQAVPNLIQHVQSGEPLQQILAASAQPAQYV